MDHKLLLNLTTYDPISGKITWNHREGDKWFNSRFAGKEAGHDTSHGYRSINFKGKNILAHRLAWFYVHAKWPTGVIDHLDGVRTNNAISNLRDATPAENRANSRQKRSRSGIAGIQRADNKWEVCVRRKNLRYRLGHYDTIPEAEAVLSSIWTSTGERG
jgi:hypothetical protein